MNYQFRKGQALVLVGPPGCGKTRTALAIAEAHGPFAEMRAEDLTSPFVLGAVLAAEPATVVVEGMPQERQFHALKSLITSNVVPANRKGLKPKMVKTPNFIFCSGDLDVFSNAGDRRFHVVELPPQSEVRA